MAYQEKQTHSSFDRKPPSGNWPYLCKFDQARGTISKLQQALEEAKNESREKIASLVKWECRTNGSSCQPIRIWKGGYDLRI